MTPITKGALLIKEKFEPIVRYCIHRITTRPALKASTASRWQPGDRHGHRGFANFRVSALFHCGGLRMLPAFG